jgi:hypothetical protein
MSSSSGSAPGQRSGVALPFFRASSSRFVTDLERGISEADAAVARMEQEHVTAETIRRSLSHFSEAYAYLTPFEKRELVRPVRIARQARTGQNVLELNLVQARRRHHALRR